VESFPLPQVAPGVYAVPFPPLPCGTQVTYFLGAQGSSGFSSSFDPAEAPAAAFEALAAASVSTVFEDHFQSDLGWSVSGSAIDGAWERGTPVGGGDRGDPPSDADGSGQCYLTDNVDGDSDVDGGTTVLLSPALDATPPPDLEALVSYQRWFWNNAASGTPGDDVLLVELSNDGGGTWVTLETVGPTGPEVSGGWVEKTFSIADHLPPTNDMRLRFTASDLGFGSIVEAGVDDARILHVACRPPRKVSPTSLAPVAAPPVDVDPGP